MQQRHVHRRRSRPRRRGGAVMETAVVLPVLLILSFGLTEVSHFFYMRHILQGAAREGARAAILANAGDPNETVERALIAAGLRPSTYDIVTDPPDLYDAEPGDLITVIVEGLWEDIGLRPMRVISGSTIVRGSAVMRKEGDLGGSS